MVETGIVAEVVKSQKDAIALIEKLFSVAKAETVYGEPVEAGNYTVITASEVSVGMGFGSGFGSGPGMPAEESETEPAESSGGGIGGGGLSTGRPLAVVSIGPEGVLVEPVVDATKIALTFLTAFSSVLITLFGIVKAKKMAAR